MSLKDWWHKHSDDMFESDDKYKFAEMLWETARRETLLDVGSMSPESLAKAVRGARLDQAVEDNDHTVIDREYETLEWDKTLLGITTSRLKHDL